MVVRGTTRPRLSGRGQVEGGFSTFREGLDRPGVQAGERRSAHLHRPWSRTQVADEQAAGKRRPSPQRPRMDSSSSSRRRRSRTHRTARARRRAARPPIRPGHRVGGRASLPARKAVRGRGPTGAPSRHRHTASGANATSATASEPPAAVGALVLLLLGAAAAMIACALRHPPSPSRIASVSDQ